MWIPYQITLYHTIYHIIYHDTTWFEITFHCTYHAMSCHIMSCYKYPISYCDILYHAMLIHAINTYHKPFLILSFISYHNHTSCPMISYAANLYTISSHAAPYRAYYHATQCHVIPYHIWKPYHITLYLIYIMTQYDMKWINNAHHTMSCHTMPSSIPCNILS